MTDIELSAMADEAIMELSLPATAKDCVHWLRTIVCGEYSFKMRRYLTVAGLLR